MRSARRLRRSFPSSLKALSLAFVIVAPMSAFGAAPVPQASATYMGFTAPEQAITVTLFLPSRDPAGAQNFAYHVSRPGDPLFHHALSAAQYAERFGARQSDYDAVVDWAASNGLAVGERYAGRTILPVTGTASTLGAAFGVKFRNYRDGSGRVYYSADSRPVLPDAISRRIAAVIGLSSSVQYAPLVKRKPADLHLQSAGTGPLGAFSAADLRSIYNVPTLNFGAQTQVLAVFEQGGYDPHDIAAYVRRNKLTSVPVIARGVNGFRGGIVDPQIELEAVLDVDMQIAMNPAAERIVVYEDGSDSFQVALLDALSAMATDDTAHTISVSYGVGEAVEGHDALVAENTVLTQLAVQGQAVFASSGDNGAYGSLGSSPPLQVVDPASQPMVTGVGGTTLFVGRQETYAGEEVWNTLGEFLGATGGGASSVWALPSYQTANGGSIAVANGGSATFRNVPDVASVGNPLTGVAVYSKLNGGWVEVGGTSVSAPLWAGFYSLICTASEGFGFGVPGFANPTLYAVNLSEPLVFPVFHDVLDGSNGDPTLIGPPGFNAGPNYDDTTGLGSFAGGTLLSQFVLLPTLAENNPPPAPTDVTIQAASLSAELAWRGVKRDNGFYVFVENAVTGATITTALTTSPHIQVTGLAPNSIYDYVIGAATVGGLTFTQRQFFTTSK